MDDEVQQLLPDLRVALERFLAAETDAEIDAAIKALPEGGHAAGSGLRDARRPVALRPVAGEVPALTASAARVRRH